MNQPPRRGSPAFYKGVAIVFFVFGAAFVWAAVRQHSWFFGGIRDDHHSERTDEHSEILRHAGE